ncbi:stage II sporulation protein R [Neobacillus sp. FSL H8-0543]|uniref:stage II sporulation protein R n=1 Tax=Neobacillus sp. FSL H8-0543 TaxID=2954672 RepID=UPI0031595635
MNSKVLVWSYLIILSFATILNLYMPKNEAIAKDSIVIPGEAIRLRILANSDSGPDQEIKRKVRDAVNAQITLWVQDLTSLEKAKEVIQSKVPEIQKIAEKVVAEQKSTQDVNVEFGKVQFPTKLYGQFLYPAGEYQAILITLGEGVGANWWCVLYPPLCFLDFSNGVAVGDGFEDNQTVKAAMMEPKVEEVDVIEEVEVEEEVLKKKPVDRDEPTDIVVEEEEPVIIDGIEESDESIEEESAPVYTAEDEQPVKVKFFVIELWESIFH